MIRLVSKQNKNESNSGKGITINSKNVARIFNEAAEKLKEQAISNAAKRMREKEMKGKKKIILTHRKKILVKKISDNIGGKGPVKPIKKLMMESGYKETTARQQSGIIDPLRESGLLDPLVESLEEKINICAKALNKKNISKQTAYSIALTMDILIKNKRLLTGKSTGNVAVEVGLDQMKKIADQIHKK
jgi:hypothetical protein